MMKRLLITTILCLSLFILTIAQTKNGFGLLTDREAYVSGEQMLVKVYHPSDNLSKIVYLDLINPFGDRVAGATLEFNGDQASGFLTLPDSISTGSYLLRSYLKKSASKTRIIRNIWITNRFTGLEKTKQLNRVVSKKPITENATDQIEITGIDTILSTKNNASAKIRLDNKIMSQIDGPLLISVAQSTPEFESVSFVSESANGKDGMAEKKGVVLSGLITDKKTSAPVAGATVYMTVPDSIPGFQYYLTQTDGRFYFQLEGYTGQVEAFVECFSKTPAQRLKITMDELFAPADSMPVFSALPLTDDFKNAAAQNVDAVTFQKIFEQNRLKLEQAATKTPETYPYYGVATNIVDPQLFIDLPNFSEISKELLPGVKYRNYNNEPTIRVMNPAQHSYFEETPLLLINGIPIQNVNVIKDMGTSDIKRVDILQSERFYGNQRFPGVVAIYSMKNDYSRIPETDQFIRVKFDAAQVKSALQQPAISDPSIPDLRQVLYWNPETPVSESISVNFKTSDVLGKYSIRIHGKLADGTLFGSEKHFEVK